MNRSVAHNTSKPTGRVAGRSKRMSPRTARLWARKTSHLADGSLVARQNRQAWHCQNSTCDFDAEPHTAVPALGFGVRARFACGSAHPTVFFPPCVPHPQRVTHHFRFWLFRCGAASSQSRHPTGELSGQLRCCQEVCDTFSRIYCKIQCSPTPRVLPHLASDP